MARPVAERAWKWAHGHEELSPAVYVDFGLDTDIHKSLFQLAVQTSKATAKNIDRILGNGKAITKFVRKWNKMVRVRHPDTSAVYGLRYKTSWDILNGG